MACLFCQIVAKEIPADIVWAGDGVLAFKDVHPKAEVHVLLVPTTHIQSLAQVTDADTPAIGRLFAAVPKVAQHLGINDEGFKLVVNTGEAGGQEVPHLHLHLLGGRPV